jgi:hypothetical protein
MFLNIRFSGMIRLLVTFAASVLAAQPVAIDGDVPSEVPFRSV